MSSRAKRRKETESLSSSFTQWSDAYNTFLCVLGRTEVHFHLQYHLPKKKKKETHTTKEKEGKGLFSFIALPDMTATMKRVWL